MSYKQKLNPIFYRNLLFLVGVTATIAYRSIVILNKYSNLAVDVAWYIGTLGFIWYFAHRYRVEQKRDKMIEERKLRGKIKECSMNEEDKQAIEYILKGLDTSKAKWNYSAIFFFSILALVYDVFSRLF